MMEPRIPFSVGTVAQLARAFNISTRRTVIAKDQNPYDGKISQVTSRDAELYKSALGTPVVADVTLKGGTYTDDNGRLVTFNDIQLVTVLVTVMQQKRIVVTEIQGKNNSVKEYIGMGDYMVGINGVLNGPNGSYPIDRVAVLKELCKAPVSIPVVSRYLQNLDIHSLVVTDFTFDQQPGGYSNQTFTINCLSDEPVELIIT